MISRIVDRQFVLGDDEKEQFLRFMREYEQFCGLQIITYCLMSNHFHILVKVPERPAQPFTDEELLTRLEALSGRTEAGTIRQRLGWFREQGHHDAAEELRQSILARMFDISAFMKLLKQRFTSWHNRRQGRKGTLWEERLRCKIRYFSDGLVFGSRLFVDEIFQTFRDRFGPRRKTGARQMKGLDQPLFTMRDLQIAPITPSG